MSIKNFRVRYWLDSLETRSSPLFSTVRAYLLTDSLKRLIAESAPIKDGKLVFQAHLEEQNRSIPLEGRRFGEAKATVLLQFGAEGRFIKMGEAQVNLAAILNEGRNGEVQSYRVEKCYDRNAKITLKVTLSEASKMQGQDMHSRSHCQLPPSRVKIRSVHNPKVITTEYEQLTDREEREEELSLVSDRHNSIGRTLNRTEVFLRKPSQAPQELMDLKTENRIYQHQMAQMQQRFREAEQEAEGLRAQLEACRVELSRTAAQCQALRAELQERQQYKEAQREQSAAQVARMLKLYQESEQERNRLLLQRQEESAKEKDRSKEFQKRISEERTRVKQLQRNENSLRKKIEEYMSQIAVYEKALKSDQKWKEKAGEALEAERKVTAGLTAQLQAAQQSCLRLTEGNSELQSQLEISRFSLCELEKEAVTLRRATRDLQSQLVQCEAELKAANETIKNERSKFARKIEELQYDTQCEQRNMEAYLEELEIKTSHEQTRNTTIATLRKEISRLKQELAAERELAEELQTQLASASTVTKQLESKLEEYHTQIVHLSRDNTLLENQIKTSREREESRQSETARTGLSEQEREELASLCYQQRDEVWKREVEALERDTKALVEKTKREKEEHHKNIKKISEELSKCEEALRKSKTKMKEMDQEEQKLKKLIKDLESKCLQTESSKSDLQLECTRLHHQNKELQLKLESIQDLQQALRENDKKTTNLKQDCDTLKGQVEREKQLRLKLRAEVKELVSAATSYLGKSDKQRAFYDELRCEHIDAELLLVFNSCAKIYCERHNRLRGKLEELEELRGQLENKEKECEKINQSLREERRSQGGSCDSINSQRTDSHSTTRIHFPNPANSKLTPRDEIEVRALRREIDELRSKLRKENNRYSDLEREVERTRHSLQESAEELRRVKEESQGKGEQLGEAREKLRVKERQLQASREELKEMSTEIASLKNQLEEVTRAFKQEKSQILKRSVVSRSFNNSRTERPDDSLKTYELEKKLKHAQDELDRIKRDKEERRTDSTQNKQAKAFQTRIKEKDETIATLRENLEEEREKTQQLKELQALKLRKLKEEFEEQIEARNKTEKELAQSISEYQEKLRQIQKKLKLSEQALKNANAQLISSAEREEKAKKMTAAEWELKMKAAQSELEAQITALNRRLDELRLSERAAKEGERRKEKEAAEVRIELERSERAVSELTDRLQLCGVRLKNMEEEENNYKEVIVALESKIKVESSEDRRAERDPEHDTFDNRSNFSLKTFTFR